MATESIQKSLGAQVNLRELMELAKGKKLFHWIDLLLISFVAIFFAFFMFSTWRSGRIPADALSLYMMLFFLQILYWTRTQRRLNAMAELLEAREDGQLLSFENADTASPGTTMTVKAQRISLKRDSLTYCLPTKGYEIAVDIELGDYDEVTTVPGELPASDHQWPKGAPLADYVKVDNRILKRKRR